jgi:translation elongation factor EF-4
LSRYATFDYEEGEYRAADLQRLDILAHGQPVDALTRLVARSEIDSVGRSIIAKMKEMMERQQFDVILQVRRSTATCHQFNGVSNK